MPKSPGPPLSTPFFYGRVLVPLELIDRADELDLLTRRLLNGERHFLIGPRRFGKTSLLLAAAARATEQGVPTILVNAESFTSLEALAGGIVAKASGLIRAPLRERILQILDWFSLLKPQAEYDALSDTIKVTVAPRENVPASRSVAEALDGLNRLAATTGQRIGIIIDEFQSVSQQEGIAAERMLRAVVQHHEHLSYIFSGSNTRMMSAMINEHARPFYRMGDALHLGPVPREEFGTFIRDAFATRGQTLTDDALAAIFSSAEDVPYNVQKLCAYLWEGTNVNGTSELTLREVEEALRVVLQSSQGNYLALFLTLTNTQRKVITATSRARGGDETDVAAARRAGVASSSYRTARAALLDVDLLREEISGGTRRYVFVDPFFAAWIAGFVEG